MVNLHLPPPPHIHSTFYFTKYIYYIVFNISLKGEKGELLAKQKSIWNEE